jgi:hypothetical protein
MSESGPPEWFDGLLWRARRRFVVGGALDATAGALVAGVASAALAHLGALAVGLAALCGALAGAGWRWAAGWPRAADLARHLDASVAATEWSAELLAARPEALPLLGRLQRERVEREIGERGGPLLPHRTWSRPLLRLVAAAALAAALVAVVRSGSRPGQRAAASAARGAATAAPAAIRAVRVEVDPPRYTGLAPHLASGWLVRAEEGAQVKFQVELTGEVDSAVLRFGEEEQALARGADGVWRAERRARQSELYALHASARGREVLRGPLARLDVVRDQPPVLQVLRPGPLTLVSAAPGAMDLDVAAHDDYAVAGVEARLVLARGLGEQVTFRELEQALTPRPAGRFTGRLDLAALGLAADVEVFLHYEAWDNREPEPGRTRSATLRIRMLRPEEQPSTALAAGIALPPALAMFRSERQIILDTEQLLRDQPHLGAAELERRAQSIGFDQRALRLRYGALLGEEVESGLAVEAAEAEVRGAQGQGGQGQAGKVPAAPAAQGPSSVPGRDAHGKAGPVPVPGTQGPRAEPGRDAQGQAAASGPDEENHSAPRGPGGLAGAGGASAAGGSAAGGASVAGGSAANLAAQLPAGMVHLHDSAESAAFFPDPLRREMRAVLAEMWGAEGRLRGVDPRGALPFEQRALRLLKDVQQRSRVYVAKVAYETPEVDPARRLTGDLAAVASQKAALAAPEPDLLRAAFAWSESVCASPTAPPLAPAPRAAAEQALRKSALAGDDQALRALAAWRAAPHPGCPEAQAIGAAIWRLLKPPPPPIARGAGER